jgi:hypothetical protein
MEMTTVLLWVFGLSPMMTSTKKKILDGMEEVAHSFLHYNSIKSVKNFLITSPLMLSLQ